MKKYINLLFFSLLATLSQAQTYKAPAEMDFAGVTVKLDEAARNIVQNDINTLLSSRRGLDLKLEKMTLYFPIIEGILAEEDVPNDFKYLCVQESSLQSDAVSSSNAVGFWQFKQATAQDFGLRIDGDIDERKNIHASTHAACLYLKKNNAILNNWISALFSYRLGLGGVSQLIPKDWAYATDIQVSGNTDFYVLRALAHKYVLSQELNKFSPPNRLLLIDYRYGGGKSINQIAGELEIDASLLQQYNLWVSNRQVPEDKEYVMTIPASATQVENVRAKSLATNAKTDFIKTDIGFPVLRRMTPAMKDANVPIIYEINDKLGILAQEGDNSSTLAEKGKLKFGDFLKYNDLAERDRIVPGEVYYLEKKEKKGIVPYHTVREGETLWKISQIYAIRMKNLLAMNRLDQVVKLLPGRVVYLNSKRPKDKPIEYLSPNAPTVPSTLPNSKPQPRPSADVPDSKPSTTGILIPEKANDPTPPSTTPEVTTTPDPAPVNNGNSRIIKTVEEDGRTATATKAKPSNTQKPAQQEPVVQPVTPKEEIADAPLGVNKERPKNTFLKPLNHTVTAGQTWYAVARQYGVSPQELFQWNNESSANPTPLKTGQRLKVFVASDRPMTVMEEPKRTEAPTPPVTAANYHTVAKGETIFSISKKYNLTVDQLRSLNKMNDNNISVGQRLKVN